MDDSDLDRTPAPSRWEAALALAVAVATLGFGWHQAGADLRVAADGIDYLSIARSTAEGHGFLLGLKWHFFHSQPPPIPAVGERPVLYPLLLAAALQARVPAGWVNVALGVTCALLLFFLLRRHGGAGAAWSGMGLFLGAGLTWHSLLRPQAELATLALVLAAGAVLAETRGLRRGIWSGLLLGLAALSRPEGLLLALPAVVYVARADGLGPAAALAGLAGGLGLGPAAFTDLPSMFAQHLRVHSLAEGMWAGYGRTLPSAAGFLAENGAGVLRQVGAMERWGLLVLGRLLGPLLLALLVLADRATRRRLCPAWGVLAAQGLLSLGISHAVWSFTSPYDPKFYLLPFTLCSGACLAVLGGWRPHGSALAVFAAGVALQLDLVGGAVHQAARAGPRFSDYGIYARSAPIRWLVENVGPGRTVAAGNPWSVHQATGLPTVLLPYGLSPEEMGRFLREYDVAAVVLNHGPEAGLYPPYPEDIPGVRAVGGEVWEVVRLPVSPP